jgi:hypothetical protein
LIGWKSELVDNSIDVFLPSMAEAGAGIDFRHE